MDAVPPGSYLTISQIASDVAATEVAEGLQRYNEQAAVQVAGRSRGPGQRSRPGHLRRSRAQAVTAG
jgi:hypothetical protein